MTDHHSSTRASMLRRALPPLLLVFMLAGCGIFPAPQAPVEPWDITTVADRQGTYLSINDSMLMPMRGGWGRSLDITFVGVDMQDDGRWRITGCIDDGMTLQPCTGVRVAIGETIPRVPASIPDSVRSTSDSTSGDARRLGAPEPELPFSPHTHLRPVAYTMTDTNGAFEIVGAVTPASILVIGSDSDLTQVFEIGRLVRE